MVERGPGPGGRAGVVRRDGYVLDTGPSVFTAPEVLADTLAAVGDKLADRLDLVPLETTYRAQFADGSHLDVHADPDAFAAEVARLAGPPRPTTCAATSADLAELYRLQLSTFIDRNLDSPLDLVGPELLTLARRGGFGRLSRHGREPSTTTGSGGCQLPGALRRGLPVPGHRRLRRHRPAGHRRRGLAPGGGHRRGAQGPGGVGRRRRGGVPLRDAGVGAGGAVERG